MQTGAMARAGRKRKSGQRHPSGGLIKPWVPRRVDFLFPLMGACEAVYVMEAGSGVVKVGRSIDPEQRIGALQVGQHCPMTLNWIIWLSQSEAVAVEGIFHAKMRQTASHAHGELYYLDPEAAIAIIEAIIEVRKVWHWQEAWFHRPWERFAELRK